MKSSFNLFFTWIATLSLLAITANETRASTVRANVLIGEGLQSIIRPLASDDTTIAGETASASADGTRAPFTGSGSASAFSQMLRTSATGTLGSTAHDENYDFEEDNGTPPVYVVQASASFNDTLQYGGTAKNYNSKYILRLTGTISGTGAFALVETNHQGSSLPVDQQWFFSESGSYNQIITSSVFVLGAGSLENFTMSIISGFNADTSTLLGSSSSGTAAFGNTLELIGIDLRDPDTNELLPQGTVVGSSGTVYRIIDAASVPEPATSAILAMAVLGGVAWRVKR